ncbi:hypothetical protein NN561_019278 [Cricetulus griseus]
MLASKAAATTARSEGDAKQGEQQQEAQARTGEDMDESSLLDLLECSVCLERLDTTAKVLPCQHTFCRRCLESIVCSRHELRCPECRILVGCGVDELPANILLVRLLDGIRQRPRTGASPGSSPPARPGPSTFPALPGGATGSPPRSPVLLPAATGSSTSGLCDVATNRSVPVAKVRIYPDDMAPLCGKVYACAHVDVRVIVARLAIALPWPTGLFYSSLATSLCSRLTNSWLHPTTAPPNPYPKLLVGIPVAFQTHRAHLPHDLFRYMNHPLTR